MAGLADIYAYYAQTAGEAVAERLVKRIVAYCEGLSDHPHRGTQRNEIYPGLRVVGYRRWGSIAFTVSDVACRVVIQGVYGRGRDVERHVVVEDN